MPTTSPLFRAAQALLVSLPPSEGPDAALVERLHRRLFRDVLPRLDAQAPLLLVALAGPNNVGKSTLFNTLTGAPLSPARAEGGLTRQCLAAVHPGGDTHALEVALGRRYELIRLPEGSAAPVDTAGPPGRLYLTVASGLPEGLVLMDTPDFDSVFRDNRAATEALLLTADVVLFVVSRQTYQNAALVEFVRSAVGAGRPYLLLYNEASRRETAIGHLDTLQAQVGHPPVARYLAPHQPAVEDGAPLAIEPLEGAPPLEKLLGEPRRAASLKRLALTATLKDALDEAESLAARAEERADAPERLRQRLRHELLELGQSAAVRSVPADAVLTAFREALDQTHPIHRAVRLPFRLVTQGMTLLGKGLRRAFTGPAPEPTAIADATSARLGDGVLEVTERLAPELAAWRGDEVTRELLREVLAPSTTTQIPGLPDARGRQEDEARFTEECRSLFIRELPRGAQGQLMQAATTFVYAVPAGAAAALSFATGGLGQDVVVWVGTLLSAPLLERFVDAMGVSVRERVVAAWARQRGATLARHLEDARFGPLLRHLDAQVDEARGTAARLREASARLAAVLEPPGPQDIPRTPEESP